MILYSKQWSMKLIWPRTISGIKQPKEQYNVGRLAHWHLSNKNRLKGQRHLVAVLHYVKLTFSSMLNTWRCLSAIIMKSFLPNMTQWKLWSACVWMGLEVPPLLIHRSASTRKSVNPAQDRKLGNCGLNKHDYYRNKKERMWFYKCYAVEVPKEWSNIAKWWLIG